MDMTNGARFLAAYEDSLREAYDRHPDEYCFPRENIPDVAARMVNGYANGTASPGPSMRSAARKVGIRPTLQAVYEYLRQPSES